MKILNYLFVAGGLLMVAQIAVFAMDNQQQEESHYLFEPIVGNGSGYIEFSEIFVSSEPNPIIENSNTETTIQEAVQRNPLGK